MIGKRKMLYRHCFLIFSIEHVIRKVQEIQEGLKLNGTHQVIVYADDVNPYPTAFPYGNGMVLHFYQQ